MTSTLMPPRWKASRPRNWLPTGHDGARSDIACPSVPTRQSSPIDPANLRAGARHPCTSTSETLAVHAVAGARSRSIPHSARAADPLLSGFLPWRFSYAGPRCSRATVMGAGIRKTSQKETSDGRTKTVAVSVVVGSQKKSASWCFSFICAKIPCRSLRQFQELANHRRSVAAARREIERNLELRGALEVTIDHAVNMHPLMRG
jgi:hypothetical protein